MSNIRDVIEDSVIPNLAKVFSRVYADAELAMVNDKNSEVDHSFLIETMARSVHVALSAQQQFTAVDLSALFHLKFADMCGFKVRD